MFGFIKKVFFTGVTILSSVNLLSALFKCVSMTNQECKVRPEIVNINSHEPVFYPFSIRLSKCGGSCNSINYPFVKISVPDVVKNLNVEVFNQMSWTNETWHIEWYETCKCKCRLDASICNNKQHWNNDKCRCECKELIDKGICDKGSIWNPSNCKFEWDKSCDIGEYLDCENCKCRKKLVDKLVAECTENIGEVKIAEITSVELHSAGHKNVCLCSYTICVMLAVILLAISVGIGAYFTYSRWYLLSRIALKQQFNELINGKSQTNRDQKSNLLFLQQYN